MPDYRFCKKCLEFHFTDQECPPVHFVFHPDYEEGKAICAINHYYAALKFAEYYNIHNEHSLIGDSVEIIVIKDDIEKKFRISAEHSIDYNANEITLT